MSRATLQPTEAEWQRTVIECAQLHGWRVAHFRPARTDRGWRTPVQADGAGFPDLVLARYGELIFAELKSERGKVRPEQADWLDHLEGQGREVHLWRPSDWPEVRERLARDWPEIRARLVRGRPEPHARVRRAS